MPFSTLKKSAAAMLLIFFCAFSQAQEPTKPPITKEKYYVNTVFTPGPSIPGGKNRKFSELAEDEQKRIPEPWYVTKKKPEPAQIDAWRDETKYRYNLDGKPIKGADIDKLISKIVYASRQNLFEKFITPEHPQPYLIDFYSDSGFNKAFSNNVAPAPKTISMEDFPPPAVYPVFPGGFQAFVKYVSANFHTPDEAENAKINVKVIVRFFVETDGTISDVKVIRDPGYGIAQEAIRVIKSSPKWTLPNKPGKPKRVEQTIPINVNTQQ